MPLPYCFSRVIQSPDKIGAEACPELVEGNPRVGMPIILSSSHGKIPQFKTTALRFGVEFIGIL